MKILTVAQARHKIAKLQLDLGKLKSERTRFALSVTRLRTIASLCQTDEELRHFAFFIAGKTMKRMQENEKPFDQELVQKAMELMSFSLENQTANLEEMRHLFSSLQASQNQTRQAAWGTVVRTIAHWDLYLIEACLQCFLSKGNPALGYELARDYCEKYDPSYGTGLIPKSVPFLEEVVGFWAAYGKQQLET